MDFEWSKHGKNFGEINETIIHIALRDFSSDNNQTLLWYEPTYSFDNQIFGRN